MKKNDKKLLFEMMGKLNPDFKIKLNESHTVRTIGIGEVDAIDVEFYGDCYVEDEGFGHIEYGSRKEFHTDPAPKCDEIEWHTPLYSPEENATIKKYLEKNYDEIKNEILTRFAKEEGLSY